MAIGHNTFWIVVEAAAPVTMPGGVYRATTPADDKRFAIQYNSVEAAQAAAARRAKQGSCVTGG
mgnify:CR=1 FL=1